MSFDKADLDPMRASTIVLLGGLLAASLALYAWRGGRESEAPRPLPAPLPAASAVASAPPLPPPPPAQAPAASPAAAARLAAVKPAASLPRPVQSSFALSSEHQALIQQTLLAAADHQLLEREPRDDAWASEAERLIRQALARHASAGDFELLAVDCRQTLCAIQAFSYGDSGHRAWVEAIDELYKETLAGLFDSVNTAFPTQGRRSPVLSFLHRRAAAASAAQP
ncbi:hypothetical protein [Roseateles violae]|uniref:Uncharacterized protein n=1 Tax=Roseateles violae TaxID=3058042 RepID=A0ABT8DUY2_9BURK|nr:hypothetical protein [Pelomonas sp. PFR6]MDN3922121.1 hypothetical protein [Pelomonas sp. PFR6]